MKEFWKNLGESAFSVAKEFIFDFSTNALGGIAGEILGDKVEQFLQEKKLKKQLTATLSSLKSEDVEKIQSYIRSEKITNSDKVELSMSMIGQYVLYECSQYDDDDDNKHPEKMASIPLPEAFDIEKINKKDVKKLSSKEKYELVDVFTNYTYSIDIEKHLEKSNFYNEVLTPAGKQKIKDMLVAARDEFVKECHDGMELDHKIIVAIVQDMFSDYTEEVRKAISEEFSNFLAQLSNDAGGTGVDLAKLRSSAMGPKYLARVCPDCGYAGPLLTYDEKAEQFHCSACGLDYSIIKGIEAEEKLLGEIDDLKKESTLISAQLKEMGDKVSGELLKLFSTTDEIASATENIDASIDEINISLDEICQNLNSYAETAVTKEFFNACLNEKGKGITEAITSIGSNVSTLVLNRANEIIDALDEIKKSAQDNKAEILSAINHQNELLLSDFDQLKASTVEILDKLDAMNAEISALSSMFLESCEKSNVNHSEVMANFGKVIEILELSRKEQIQKSAVLRDQIRNDFRSELERNGISNPAIISSNTPQGASALTEDAMIKIVQNAMKPFLLARNGDGKIDGLLAEQIKSFTDKVDKISDQTEEIYEQNVNLLTKYGIEQEDPAGACPFCRRATGKNKESNGICRCSSCNQKYYLIDPYKRKTKDDFAKIDSAVKLPTDLGENILLKDYPEHLIEQIGRWRSAHKITLEKIENRGKVKIHGKSNEDEIYWVNIDEFLGENNIELKITSLVLPEDFNISKKTRIILATSYGDNAFDESGIAEKYQDIIKIVYKITNR